LRADRERYQRERPTPEQLLAEGGHSEFVPLGELLMLHQLRTELKHARERQRITLAELSESTGIDQAALSRFETGRNANPTLDTIYRIASALGKVISFTCQDARNGVPESPSACPSAATQPFADYLKKALDRALQDEKEQKDDGNLRLIHDVCRRGARQNWARLTPRRFLKEYLWCVGSIRKDYAVHADYYPCQMELFYQCNVADIVSNAKAIRASWKKNKCNLSPRMFKAVMSTAADVAQDWAAFRSDYLPPPPEPESESQGDWMAIFNALDRLPMVGWAIGWYLIRNLYGGCFFKPDQHIEGIARRFFKGDLNAMAAAVRELWPRVCSDPRFLDVHLGEVDYILWWYRQATNDPSDTDE
jgi:transcriptional regulator with XRE-family HTH domain